MIIRSSFLVEFELGLAAIFSQPLVPYAKTSQDHFSATSPSFPPEICINKLNQEPLTETNQQKVNVKIDVSG